MAKSTGNIFAGYSTSPIHPNLPAPKSHKPKPARQHPNRNNRGRGHGNSQPNRNNGPGPFNATNYGSALNFNDAVRLAKMIGGLQYNQQIGQIHGLQANVPHWFDQYRQAVQNAQTQTNTLSQPLLTQAQQAQTNTGQTLGLTGAAGSDDALAAASRQQQAAAMAQALQGVANANSDYYTQTGLNSYGAQTTANQQLGQQLAGLKGARSQANVNALLGIRNDDRQYGLEVQTLLGNQANDAAQAANTRAGIRAGTRKAQNDFLAKNGVSQGTWRHMTPKERVAWKREWNRSSQTPAARLDAARLRYFQKHGYFPPTGPPGSKAGGAKDQFGNTPRQQRAANSAWTKARSVAGQISKPSDSWRTVYRLLLGSSSGVSSVDSDTLKVAAMRATKTRIPRSLMESLRKQGVDVAQIRNPPGNKPARSGATGNQAPGANGQRRPT